jgi:hypothetical protein
MVAVDQWSGPQPRSVFGAGKPWTVLGEAGYALVFLTPRSPVYDQVVAILHKARIAGL